MSNLYQRVSMPRLREKLCPMLSSSPRSFIRSKNGSNETGGGEDASTNEMGKCQSSVNLGTSCSPEGSNTVGKRSLGQDDDGESHGGKRLRSRSATRSINEGDIAQRFACPYFKKNPKLYRQQRSCQGPGWVTVHRVKEHVYRKHALPISCPRCHTSFESEKHKDEHIAAPVRCEIRDVSTSTEGMSTTQKEQLRSRKKSAKDVTEAEKWRQVYLILFPNADIASIPSPYYELASTNLEFPSQEMSRYEQFLQQELPDTVREELELRIDQYLSPIETSLRCQLVGIVRDMQIQLFDLYKSIQYGNKNEAELEGIPDMDLDLFPLPRTDEDVDDVNNFEDELQHLHQPPYLEQLADLDSFENLDFSFSISQSSSAILDLGDQNLFDDSEGR